MVLGEDTVLHKFTGTADGGHPKAGLIRNRAGYLFGIAAGYLYGTAFAGGTSGQGVVYRMDTTGNYTVLYNFSGGADAGQPMAGVIHDAAGNLYGTASTGGRCPRVLLFKIKTQ